MVLCSQLQDATPNKLKNKTMKNNQFQFHACSTVSARKARLVNIYFRLLALMEGTNDARRRTLTRRSGIIAAAAYEA